MSTMTSSATALAELRRAEQHDAERSLLRRIGGTCAIVGGLGYLAVAVTHGRLPDESVETTLGHVASRPQWQAVHLVGIVCVLLWVAAIAGLAGTLRRGPGRVLGVLAVLGAVIGAAIYVVDFSIDGYALKHTADAWVTAVGPEREVHRQLGMAMTTILRGTVLAASIWSLGLPFLLSGLAVAVDRGYPRWLGLVPALTGGVSVLGGFAAFLLDSHVGFLVALAASALSAGWLVVMGATMWRRSLPAAAR